MAAELVIRGGTVVDGTGSPGRRADVAVTGGRVTGVAEGLRGDRELDAGGCVVAPGFVDIHTHYDAQVLWDPRLTPSCFHGVTTVVTGNCGFSLAPTRPAQRGLLARTLEKVEDMAAAALAEGITWEFESHQEYLAAVGRRGSALNVTAFVGHTALRLFVLGDDAYERAATPEEVATMGEVLRGGLVAGAAGFSSSFSATHLGAGSRPVPSRLADRGELLALLGVLGEVGRGVFAVSPGTGCTVDDLYDWQPGVGVPFTYGALLSSPTGVHRERLAANRDGWARGAQVWPQVTPRPATFVTSMAAPFTFNPNPAFGELGERTPEERRRAYADPRWRERARSGWDAYRQGGQQAILVPRWDAYQVATSTARPDLDGVAVAEAARRLGVPPLDALLDLALAEPDLALRVRCVFANDDEEEVAALLADDRCVLGLSDAGAHFDQICDAPQATDYLGNWVRDRGVVPLEEAVRRLTSLPAGLFGMVDRGVLRPGAWADVTVFDPATVGPGPVRRVRDFPGGTERLTADRPDGVRHVLVNGVPIRTDAVQAPPEVRPGQVVALAAGGR